MKYSQFLFMFLSTSCFVIFAEASGNVARVVSTPPYDSDYEYVDSRTGKVIQRSPEETAKIQQARKGKQAAIQAASDAKTKFKIHVPWSGNLSKGLKAVAPLALGSIILGQGEDVSAATPLSHKSNFNLSEDTLFQKSSIERLGATPLVTDEGQK